MEDNQENQQLINLINAIKHVSLNHNDLMDVSLEYSNIYFRNKKKEEQEFDKFWANPVFLEQTVLAAREGIVLGMQAITLDEALPFSQVVNHCIDLEVQRYNESQITTNSNEISYIQDFLAFLRKELFSRVYSQNKELQKVSKIPKAVLQDRYNYFMKQAF